MKTFVLLLFALISAAIEVAAQTGTVVGLTCDPEKRPIAGVLVVLSDDRFVAKTDSLGWFLMRDVPVGAHQLYAVDSTHMRQVVRNIRVESGKTALLRITLYDWVSRREHRFNEQYRMPLFVPDSSIQYR
jgi:hypothetical protein